MKILEVRRHSIRKQGGGSQLSQAGVELARRLGATMGPFAYVATSVVPRARETAIAMGFAVDQELVTLASDKEMYAELEANRWWEAGQPFVALAKVIAVKGPTWYYAHALIALWRDLLAPLPDGAAALVIAHSGEIEVPLVACFPDASHGAWGVTFGHCEGARLVFDGEPVRFTEVEILRCSS
jgi:broad specificity phosphatase PhoE